MPARRKKNDRYWNSYWDIIEQAEPEPEKVQPSPAPTAPTPAPQATQPPPAPPVLPMPNEIPSVKTAPASKTEDKPIVKSGGKPNNVTLTKKCHIPIDHQFSDCPVSNQPPENPGQKKKRKSCKKKKPNKKKACKPKKKKKLVCGKKPKRKKRC